MKTLVTFENNKFYIIDNNIKTEITKIIFDKKQQKDVLKLPENSTGRQWVIIDKIIKAGGILELQPVNKNNKSTDNKSIRDWLSPEDQVIYDNLVKKAKLRAKIAKHQAIIDELVSKMK